MTQDTPDNIDLSEVDDMVARKGRGPEALIPLLQCLEERYHFLPRAALERICEITEITPASIAGVSTFYAQFRHRPCGSHTVKVCTGTACHVQGGEHIFGAFRRHLGISGDEDTDRDRLFTVERVACLGCCMLAPAAQIDGITYGFVEQHRTGEVLADFLKETAVACDNEPTTTGKGGEVRICLCSSCVASGASKVYRELKKCVAEWALPATLKEVGCLGISYLSPVVEIAMPGGERFRYGKVSPVTARTIMLRHFESDRALYRISGRIYRFLEGVLADPVTPAIGRIEEDAYLRRQHHLATEHCGELTPLDIDDYVRHGGFSALRRVLTELSPAEVIDRIGMSGLRGRGGAGFPTGKKWAAMRAAPGAQKYIICNGDEGDPGAFMDRMLLECFPFRVLEGMAIAARCVGSHEGFLYIRAEYPLAVRRVEEALAILERNGFLGDHVLGSDFALRLKLVQGAGAFVCGEETALISAIEGKRGMPRYRPPFPAQRGLWGKPTLVNNVETFALVPWILRNGHERFAALGTETSKGTKTFALAGKIARTGLIEVPMGTTLREIVEEIGGGVPKGRKFKAVQIGGPSGGCIPESLSDTPVDYEKLSGTGAIMGSGGIVILDDSDCMVDIARYFLQFTQRESCGKCTFCRIGTRRMLEILDRLCEGRGKAEDLEELERLAKLVGRFSLCGLGKTAPNPVSTTLRYFRSEYEAHLEGRCPAKKCSRLISYRVNEKCIGCTICAQRCPVGAIALTPYLKHEIDAQKCIRCGTCLKVCPNDAVEVK